MRTPTVAFGVISFIIATTLATLISCGGDDQGSLGPTTGALRVTTESGGIGTDPDGYVLRLDDATEGPIGDPTPVVLTGLAAGDHTVALDNVVSFCAVDGGFSRTVAVPAGDTVDVTFAVTCRAVGGLDISVSTSGGTPDLDGYSVSVDQAPGQAIDPNGTLSVGDVEAGSHGVTLSGLSFNCQADGANPTTVDVAPEAVTRVALMVTCGTLAPWRGIFLKLRRDTITDASGYTASLSDVFSVDPGSGAITGLTQSPSFDISPQLSPDHTKVVFDRADQDTYWRIAIVGVDGTGLHELETGANIVGGHRPIWSPDGSRIAFVLDPHSLRVMNADGTGEAEVFSFANPPLAWSPDGTFLATTGGPNANHRTVHIVRADGTGSVAVTNNQGSALDAVWSPDGRRLAYTVRTTFDQAGGDYYDDVWITNADGSERHPLTHSTPAVAFAGSRHPRWSPDGKRILFESGVTYDRFDLYTMQPDGTGLINLTNTPDRHEFDGEWSSDGTKILFTVAFASDCGTSVPNAFIMSSDGSGVTNLSHNSLLCPV